MKHNLFSTCFYYQKQVLQCHTLKICDNVFICKYMGLYMYVYCIHVYCNSYVMA